MEVITLQDDIKVFYVTSTSFPEGIGDATSKLHSLFPFSHSRKIFGLSRPENGGKIVYRAAAEELESGEAEKLGCDRLIIKNGNYISLKVENFREDIMSIDRAFKKLLKVPKIDPEGYCVEWYQTNGEIVICMVRMSN